MIDLEYTLSKITFNEGEIPNKYRVGDAKSADEEMAWLVENGVQTGMKNLFGQTPYENKCDNWAVNFNMMEIPGFNKHVANMTTLRGLEFVIE